MSSVPIAAEQPVIAVTALKPVMAIEPTADVIAAEQIHRIGVGGAAPIGVDACPQYERHQSILMLWLMPAASGTPESGAGRTYEIDDQ